MAPIIGSEDAEPDDLRHYLELIVGRNPEIFGSCIAFEPGAFIADSVYYAPYVFKGEEGLVYKFLHSRELPYFTQEWYEVPVQSGKPHCRNLISMKVVGRY